MPTFHHFLKQLKSRGIDALNDLFPRFEPVNDLYSERVKAVLLLVCSFSLVMMVTSPIGWLYACFPRPFHAFIFYLHRIPINEPPTPEWGIHYVTLFMYCFVAYISLCYMENRGIDKPFHKLVYVFALTILTFFVPFELIYITLYDVFHNIPLYGKPLIWLAGTWNKTFTIQNTVLFIDVGLSIMCVSLMYIIKWDLNDYIKTKIEIDRISFVFLVGYVVTMVIWVMLPVYIPSLPEWGTNYFPQTIYFEYGYFSDYNIDIPYDSGYEYGIVDEYWYPNDTIKYLNHLSKLFSVCFMFYTFIPRTEKILEIVKVGNSRTSPLS